jgi:dTMP kinase
VTAGRRPGRLVAFEGGEASGKSTQARLLAEAWGARLTHEPGDTAVGGRIRALVLDVDVEELDARAEALLMAADRAQHVAEVVAPALEAGRDVVTDRYVGSSLAYQGHGRGLDVEELRRLSAWATGGLLPDVVVLLDVAPEVARRRRAQSTAAADDRMEAEDEGFHRRVAGGYRALAAAEPDRWVVVDGEGPVDEVARRVRAAVDARLGDRVARGG